MMLTEITVNFRRFQTETLMCFEVIWELTNDDEMTVSFLTTHFLLNTGTTEDEVYIFQIPANN